MSWTDERVEILTKMWAEGNSASQIAKELGGVTRNAVIGKVHRLGLSNRATTNTANKSDTKTKTATKSSTKAKQKARKIEATEPSASEISPEALARVNEIEKKAKKLSLLELTEKTCKWPVGDPATEDFWFCGLATQSGKPYCEAHVGVAFQPMNSRRDRRR